MASSRPTTRLTKTNRNQNLSQDYAYHVPYRSILPKPAQCDNLLVPVALSCTHVGISSLRIEGAWMVIGQAAGVAAALTAKDNVPVQEVKTAKLRERLLAQKQVLDLPEAPDESTATTPDFSINPKTLQGIVLDDMVGKLKREGLFDNTILFFLTDNGGSNAMRANNAPLRGFKASLDEGEIRTPFIVSWPDKFQGGRTVDTPVISFDILPTVLDGRCPPRMTLQARVFCRC